MYGFGSSVASACTLNKYDNLKSRSIQIFKINEDVKTMVSMHSPKLTAEEYCKKHNLHSDGMSWKFLDTHLLLH